MFGRLALHTWSLDTTPLAEAIAAAKAGGFDAIELRRIDFVRCHQRGLANEAVIDLVRAQGMPVHMLGCEYGWLFGKGADNDRLFDVLEESCENAVALDCPLIMVAPGQNAGPASDAIENLKRGADICGKYGLTLAVEHNSQHPVINGIAPLREIVQDAGRPNAGMLLDAYHLERAGLGGASFADVAPQEIAAFQYSDVPAAPVNEGVKRPTDRLPPAGNRPLDRGISIAAREGLCRLLELRGPKSGRLGASACRGVPRGGGRNARSDQAGAGDLTGTMQPLDRVGQKRYSGVRYKSATPAAASLDVSKACERNGVERGKHAFQN
jgi:sugar phosphate isomerase/epimerase